MNTDKYNLLIITHEYMVKRILVNVPRGDALQQYAHTSMDSHNNSLRHYRNKYSAW